MNHITNCEPSGIPNAHNHILKNFMVLSLIWRWLFMSKHVALTYAFMLCWLKCILIKWTCTKRKNCEQQQNVCGSSGLNFLSDWEESVMNKYERLTSLHPQDKDEKIKVHWKYNTWNHNKRVPTVHASQSDVHTKTRNDDPHQTTRYIQKELSSTTDHELQCPNHTGVVKLYT